MLSIKKIHKGRSAINQKNQKWEKCDAINQKNQQGRSAINQKNQRGEKCNQTKESKGEEVQCNQKNQKGGEVQSIKRI